MIGLIANRVKTIVVENVHIQLPVAKGKFYQLVAYFAMRTYVLCHHHAQNWLGKLEPGLLSDVLLAATCAARDFSQ